MPHNAKEPAPTVPVHLFANGVPAETCGNPVRKNMGEKGRTLTSFASGETTRFAPRMLARQFSFSQSRQKVQTSSVESVALVGFVDVHDLDHADFLVCFEDVVERGVGSPDMQPV